MDADLRLSNEAMGNMSNCDPEALGGRPVEFD
jgi:hypothetical protein